MSAALLAIIALVGTGLGSVATYLVGRRDNSGTIKTSTADRLWAEASGIRGELHDQIADLRHRCDVAERRCDIAERAHHDCQTELAAVRRELAAMRRELAEMREGVA